MSRALWWAGLPARVLLLGLISGYRRLFRGTYAGRCRFHPSCSAYAEEAIRVHGAFKGGGLALWRVLRCSPLTPGGVDQVPPRRDGVIQGSA
ncbi:MAG TPA: membrane protein insertion efficiency factor YidD [Actinomycetota bacterium]